MKVVGDYCNLKCSYCFYNEQDQSTRHVMSADILEKFTRQYLELFGHNKELQFVWLGGEPLLAGLPFFQNVVEFQARYATHNQTITNKLQTNATLITDKWARFFREYDFKIGVSIDGDRMTHDLARLGRKGQGTFDRVMRGIHVLEEHGLRYGVVQVLTSQSIPRLKESFDFFVNRLNLTHWSVNTYLHDHSDLIPDEKSVTNAQLTVALKTLIDLWIRQDDERLTIREIESFVHGALNKRYNYCTFCGTCTYYFCVNYDGQVYPCDSFTTDPRSTFGDLTHQSLLEILDDAPDGKCEKSQFPAV